MFFTSPRLLEGIGGSCLCCYVFVCFSVLCLFRFRQFGLFALDLLYRERRVPEVDLRRAILCALSFAS